MDSSDDVAKGEEGRLAGSETLDIWDDFDIIKSRSGKGREDGIRRGPLGYVSTRDTNTTLIDEPVPPLESYGLQLERKLWPALSESKRDVLDTHPKEDIYGAETPRKISVGKPCALTLPSLFDSKTNVPSTPIEVGRSPPKYSEAKPAVQIPIPEEKEQDLSSLLDFAMFDDMVTIPDMGTFKRKPHFRPLATPKSIEEALRRRTLPSALPISQLTH